MFDEKEMVKFVANRIFWIFHHVKDVIHINKNVLVIVSAICFGCRSKLYIGISSTELETNFFHGRAYVDPIVSTSTLSAIEGTDDKGSTTKNFKTKLWATYMMNFSQKLCFVNRKFECHKRTHRDDSEQHM